MLQQIPKYLFGQYKFNQQTLTRLASILKQQSYPVNEEIKFFGDVRLLDDNNKLIGIFSCDEAKKKAQKKNKDIIMLNKEVRPVLCKMCDYSDELATKFVEDVAKLKSSKSKDQSMKLGHNINQSDLQLKVNVIQEILKKQNKIRIYIICPLTNAIQSKTILYQIRDLCTQFMTPLGDIKIKDYEAKDDYTKPKDEIQEEQIQLEYEFEAMQKQTFRIDIAQPKLEKMINSVYQRIKNASKLQVEEAISEIKKQGEDGVDELSSKFSGEKLEIKRKQKQQKSTQEWDDDEDDEDDMSIDNNIIDENKLSQTQEVYSKLYIKDVTFEKYKRFAELINKAQKLKL